LVLPLRRDQVATNNRLCHDSNPASLTSSLPPEGPLVTSGGMNTNEVTLFIRKRMRASRQMIRVTRRWIFMVRNRPTNT
jgi:hypothetical protein